jgi:hypothetical protein
MKLKDMPSLVKKEAKEIVEQFNKELENKEVFYVPKFKGRFLYLNRSEYGRVSEICRLEYTGRMEDWTFAIFKYSTEEYEEDEIFPGEEFVDGTIVGAMKAGMRAYRC